MTRTPSRNDFRISLRVYRTLLRLYPRRFREEFGEALEQHFDDVAQRASLRGSVRGRILLWIQIPPDLLVTAFREHIRADPDVSAPDRFAREWTRATIATWLLGMLVLVVLAFLDFRQPMSGYFLDGPDRLLVGALLGGLVGWAQSAVLGRRVFADWNRVDRLRWTATTAFGATVWSALYFDVLVRFVRISGMPAGTRTVSESTQASIWILILLASGLVLVAAQGLTLGSRLGSHFGHWFRWSMASTLWLAMFGGITDWLRFPLESASLYKLVVWSYVSIAIFASFTGHAFLPFLKPEQRRSPFWSLPRRTLR